MIQSEGIAVDGLAIDWFHARLVNWVHLHLVPGLLLLLLHLYLLLLLLPDGSLDQLDLLPVESELVLESPLDWNNLD